MATSISTAENGHLAARLSDGRQFGAPKSLKLVHSVPGRVRLGVPRVAGDDPYAARLATLIEQHEAVDAVRVSAPTASIVIRHQPLISADGIRALVERQAGAACDPTVPVPELAPRPTPAHRKWLPALPAGLAFLSGPLGVPIPATMMLGGVAAGAFPIAQRAVRSLATERRLTLDVMDTTAIVLTTLQGEGTLHIRAERVGSDTRAGRIIGLVQDAPVHDTRVENYAAKAADRILLPSFLLSGGLLLLTRNPSVAASILITDFLTGIRVSVPTTVLASMTSAGRRGILVRSGRAMEKLAAVDTIVFDKTGTVTRGEPTITGVEAARDAMAPAEVLAMAAAANQRLRHPLAEAVVRYARERGIEP